MTQQDSGETLLLPSLTKGPPDVIRQNKAGRRIKIVIEVKEWSLVGIPKRQIADIDKAFEPD